LRDASSRRKIGLLKVKRGLKMKLLIASLLLSSSAFASPVIGAQSCANASRGIILMVPRIADGHLAGPLRVTKLIRTLTEVSADSVSDLKVSDSGLVAFNGKDENGNAVKVASTRNEHGRLIIQVTRKDLGMVGFTCSATK
jgi:hypothetical protein